KQQRTDLATEFPLGTQFVGVTADGNYLLGRSVENKLTRWRIAGNNMVLQETSIHPYRGWANVPLVVSADGQWLAHPINNKLPPKIDVPIDPPSDYAVAVYKIND